MGGKNKTKQKKKWMTKPASIKIVEVWCARTPMGICTPNHPLGSVNEQTSFDYYWIRDFLLKEAVWLEASIGKVSKVLGWIVIWCSCRNCCSYHILLQDFEAKKLFCRGAILCYCLLFSWFPLHSVDFCIVSSQYPMLQIPLYSWPCLPINACLTVAWIQTQQSKKFYIWARKVEKRKEKEKNLISSINQSFYFALSVFTLYRPSFCENTDHTMKGVVILV